MPEDRLPGLEEISASSDQWVLVRGPVSHPTATNGDWRTFPHLASKENWKQLMGARAELFEKFLEDRRIYVNECPICSKFARGMQAAFGGHVGAQYHFKYLGKVALLDGMPVNEARASLWQEFCVPGGAVRFNHADGAVEMTRGSYAGSATAPLPSMTPVTPSGPEPPLQGVESLQVEGQWIRVSHPMGMPTQDDGDYRTCCFFDSKNVWKQAVHKPAGKMLQLLEKYNVWPECKLCPQQPASFAEHIPAEKHFRSLESKLTEGIPVKVLANTFWQQWNVPGGALRFNHIHGAIDMWRGQPPKLGEEEIASATSMPQAPLASNSSPLGDPEQSHENFVGAAGAAAVLKHGGKPEPAALETEGQWYVLCSPVSMAQVQGGDWRAYSHMQSRHVWKAAMSAPAALVCQVLEGQRTPIHPACCFCDRSLGYQEHVPADKHFRMIYDRFLKDGLPVERVRDDAWQQWLLPGGAIRLNHLDGSVEMCKGAVPAAGSSSVMPTSGGLLDKRTCDSPGPRPPVYEPNELQPQPQPASRAPLGEPDAEPLATSSQSSLANRGVAPLPAAVASSGTEQDATLQLCKCLWSRETNRTADEIELQLRDIPVEQLRCNVCEQSMSEGVADHLLSGAHMMRLAAVIARGGGDLLPAGGGTPPSWSPLLVQCWDLPGGGQFKLCHFPLEAELVQAPPPEPRNYQHLHPEWQEREDWRAWASRSQAAVSEVIPASSEVAGLPHAAVASTHGGAQSGAPVWWQRHECSNGGVYWERSDEQIGFYDNNPEWQSFSAGEGRGSYYYNSRTRHWFWETGKDMGVWRD